MWSFLAGLVGYLVMRFLYVVLKLDGRQRCQARALGLRCELPAGHDTDTHRRVEWHWRGRHGWQPDTRD